jgi:hypothetical protein
LCRPGSAQNCDGHHSFSLFASSRVLDFNLAMDAIERVPEHEMIAHAASPDRWCDFRDFDAAVFDLDRRAP